MDTPVMSITMVDEDGNDSEISGEEYQEEREVDYTRNYWEDEDDIYQEFEELDFEALPDRSDMRRIASDDSFYPPDNSVMSDMYRSPSPESISFFKACCNNNSIIVKIMIRQGMSEEEVWETDKNRRSHQVLRSGQQILEQLQELLKAQCAAPGGPHPVAPHGVTGGGAFFLLYRGAVSIAGAEGTGYAVSGGHSGRVSGPSRGSPQLRRPLGEPSGWRLAAD
ncbi:unnamed protein product [Pleuronectes platessa]|uniref:Uncharacterized protein n=1 Tax=Pleuronectes platessa TaxID=8262 RepID=A0A9N7THU2_PLEPL|nr:unnamed protein product [Pleuronectes platessa]